MPRYHFHLVDGRQLTDIKGIELSGESAARIHAEQLADSFGDPFRCVRVVSNEGKELFRVKVPDQKVQ